MEDRELNARLRGRDFLTLADFTPEEIAGLLDVAAGFKAGCPAAPLAGKTVGLLFRKASTRTRVSFEVAVYQLGGHSLFLTNQDLQLGRGEPVADTARVLSRYLQALVVRTFAHEELEELARYADIPVINGLTDLLHPCQVLADLLTVREKKGKLAGVKLAFIGDGNNMAHSLLLGGVLAGMEVRVATPPGYGPQPRIVARAEEIARQTGAAIAVTADPRQAAAGADVLYTDVWASMGQETEAEARRNDFAGYQINDTLLAAAAPEAVVMHCLPAHRGEEITAGVLAGPQAVVWDQAENRLHAQKAILAMLLGEEGSMS
ncbi:MAG: ornithine carbamoyltransferase [Clostridia bacterium]|nr:MAG: ornithine carbamoyltransferase [Clostridia bacterium]